MMCRLLIAVGIIVSLSAGCAPAPADEGLTIHWAPVESLNSRLSDGVTVYEGSDDEAPVKAWYVRVDTPEIRVEAVVSDDADRRETASSLAADLNACVLINAGYFRMDLDPAEHVSLLVAGDSTFQPALSGVLREEGRYPTTRAALGFDSAGRPAITWVATLQGTTRQWDAPWPNRPGQPAQTPEAESGQPWTVQSAVAAGPVIVEDGEVHITIDEEVFFDTSIPNVHPRSAAGITREGDLILMVVDGRQPYSRGVSLEELAALMLQVGAVEALNLDGGGSSTLIVDGQLVNLPSGAPVEREIMSALAVYCSP